MHLSIRHSLALFLACASPIWFAPTASVTDPNAITAQQGAGLSVEPRAKSGNSGFDFKCKFGSSSTTLTIDPLGTAHSDSGSLSSPDGTISLSAKYDRGTRNVIIVATRGGKEIGRYSWRVSASLE
jgi:hypothetical protein